MRSYDGFSKFSSSSDCPKFQRYVHRDQSSKMVFVINHELKMGKGKIAAQVGHAAVKATLKSGEVHPEFSMPGFRLGRKNLC